MYEKYFEIKRKVPPDDNKFQEIENEIFILKEKVDGLINELQEYCDHPSYTRDIFEEDRGLMVIGYQCDKCRKFFRVYEGFVNNVRSKIDPQSEFELKRVLYYLGD